MRVIDADRMKAITPNWLLETDGMRKRMLYDELDRQPTVIEGMVDGEEEGENLPTHKRFTRVKPIAHHYMPNNQYIKYSCPVCDALNNRHQVHPGETNCCLCNVNLLWEED
jgi:hypothetical protein